MCDWSRWTQSGYTDRADAEWERLWFAMSFARQMTEIEGELSRVIRDEHKLNRIRKDAAYLGELQVIRRLFEYIKKDPKNSGRLQEAARAEKLTFEFLAGASGAPSQEELSNYWKQYLEAYIAELKAVDEAL